MYSNRSFLILGSGGAADIVSLIKGGYEVADCEFGFEQGTDRKGKVQTRVRGGLINLLLPMLPPKPISEWMLGPRKYISGAIVVVDAENLPIEKIIFEDAACTGMAVDYIQTGDVYMHTRISLQAKLITVGNGIDFDCEWVM